jgi:acetyl-CoA carboxylase biotin carboxyl carrier protein
MADKDADVLKIKELIKIMKENDLVKIDIRHGEDSISLRRAEPSKSAPVAGPIIASLPGAAAPVVPTETSGSGPGPQQPDNLLEIKSPIVGTFYEGASPDSDPFVELGSHVGPQTVVCIVEAMKVMNEIKAEVSGKIAERLVANGQAVEYGQVLFRVEPD